MSESDEDHLVLALWRFFRGRTEIPVAELPASIRFLYIATRDRWAAQRPSSYSRKERRANGRKGGLATQARNRTAQAHAQGHPSAPAQAPTSTTTATATAAAPTKTSHFIPPTEDEVRAYCAEKKHAIDAEAFVAYYTSNGWKIGRASMKSWTAALVTWNKRNKDPNEDGKYLIELWKHAPLLPGLDKLDPLSTIITTLDIANDERVAGEQDEILENFKW